MFVLSPTTDVEFCTSRHIINSSQQFSVLVCDIEFNQLIYRLVLSRSSFPNDKVSRRSYNVSAARRLVKIRFTLDLLSYIEKWRNFCWIPASVDRPEFHWVEQEIASMFEKCSWRYTNELCYLTWCKLNWLLLLVSGSSFDDHRSISWCLKMTFCL